MGTRTARAAGASGGLLAIGVYVGQNYHPAPNQPGGQGQKAVQLLLVLHVLFLLLILLLLLLLLLLLPPIYY